MVFRIVEVKAKDLYTIYDVANGGVCCCSRYTIEQLLSEGHSVEGVIKGTNGRMNIVELSLDGKARTKKAPIICEDETKRSAVTILKGLDEKHYPRVKQERRSIGSIVMLTYEVKKTKEKVKETALQVAQGKFLLVNGDFLFTEAHPELVIENYVPNNEELEQLQKLKVFYDKINQNKKDQQNLIDGYDKKIAVLDKERQKLVDAKNAIIEEFEQKNLKVTKQQEKCISDYKYRDVTGDELCYYTFIGRNSTVTKEKMFRVVERTKRKLIYTHGLAYRHPTTYRVPVSKQEALRHMNDSFVDIDARNPEYIHINTYSDNDLF